MEFVEDDAGNIRQFGIVLQHAGEDALGHDLDAGVAADLGIEAGAVAHRSADGLIQGMGHAVGDGTGREAARLEHEDLFSGQPRAASKASGTTVLLPAPGGACTSSVVFRRSVSPIAGNTSVIGKRGSGTGRVVIAAVRYLTDPRGMRPAW